MVSGWLRIFAGDGRIVGELTLGSLPGALAGSALTPAAYIALVVTAHMRQQLAFFGAAAILVWRRSREVIVFTVAVFLLTYQAAEFPPEIVAIMPTDPLRGWLELVVVFTFLMVFAWLFFLPRRALQATLDGAPGRVLARRERLFGVDALVFPAGTCVAPEGRDTAGIRRSRRALRGSVQTRTATGDGALAC